MPDDRFSKRDMERNEEPQIMGGAVGSATGAGAAAAAGFAALGPVGAVIGLLAGLAGGWWAGKELIQAVEEVDREDSRFRRAHEHTGGTRAYEEDRHAYRLGFLAGRNPEYAGRPFDAVEEDLRTAWVRAHVHDVQPTPWEHVRDAVATGYDLARGRD